MTLTHLFLLAIIQGITEFLPVSSSGHLALLPLLSNQPDQGQAIDVAVHLGTLGAVILYFWKDVRVGILGLPRLLRGKIDTQGAKLAFLLIIATIPAVIFGLIIKLTDLDEAMRNPAVIGWAMLLFGLVLYWADQKGGFEKKEANWTKRDAVIMGFWQVLALIPGTSRSGATISGARALGYNRADSAKLSMLMSIPIIIASATLLGAEVAANADAQMAKDGAIAAALSFVAALIAIRVMMGLLQRISFTPYVIYRIILGVSLIAYSYM